MKKKLSHCSTVDKEIYSPFKCWQRDSFTIQLLAIKRFIHCLTIDMRFVHCSTLARNAFTVQLLARDSFTFQLLTKRFIHFSTVGKEIHSPFNCWQRGSFTDQLFAKDSSPFSLRLRFTDFCNKSIHCWTWSWDSLIWKRYLFIVRPVTEIHKIWH